MQLHQFFLPVKKKKNILIKMNLLFAFLAKAIELDMKIPFISKLRKYTSLHYRPEEIKKAEIHIIKLLDWQL